MPYTVQQIEIPGKLVCGDPPERHFDIVLVYESKVVLARGRKREAVFSNIESVAQAYGATIDELRRWPTRIVSMTSWPCGECGRIIHVDPPHDATYHGRGCRSRRIL